MSTARGGDLGLGFGLVFGLLSVGAAAYLVAAPTQQLAAYGFGAAVALGALAVAAIHVYGA